MKQVVKKETIAFVMMNVFVRWLFIYLKIELF